MEAYIIRKSPMLEANFGEELLWSSIGTSAERPMLHVRSMVNGEGRWAQFIDRHFFQKARQKLKMHANNASSNGIWVGKSKPSQLADKVNPKEFAKGNKARAEGRQTALWPVKDSQWQRLEFTSLVCPVCLVVSDVSEQQYGDKAAQVICKCEGKGHQHRARDLKGVTIWDALCLEKALKCKSSQDMAQSYRNACINAHKPQMLEGDFVPPKPLPSAAPVESSVRAPSKPPVGASPKAALGAPAEAPSAAAVKAPSKQPKQQQPKAKQQRKQKQKQKPKQQEQQPKHQQPESKQQRQRQSKAKAEVDATAKASASMHKANASAKAAAKEAVAAVSTKFDRRVEALTKDEAVPAEGKQPMLGEYQAVIKVTQQAESSASERHLEKFNAATKSTPAEGCLQFTISVPRLSKEDAADDIVAWAYDRGMTVESIRECEDTRCLFVVLAHGAGVNAWDLFDAVRKDATEFLNTEASILDMWADIAAADIVQPRVSKDEAEDTARACAMTASSIVARSQKSDLAFLRFAWPKLLGSKSVLNAYMHNGHLVFELYLAAEGPGGLESRLDEEVIRVLCHDEHAYATIWEDANDLKTLRQVLRFLGKMNRRADIGVVCCTSIEHTRQGKWYTVPEYISGHNRLNCTKSTQMGFKVGGRSQEEQQGADIETTALAMAASTKVTWEKAGKSRHARRKHKIRKFRRRMALRKFTPACAVAKQAKVASEG